MINELITDFSKSCLSGVGGPKTDQVSFKLEPESEAETFQQECSRQRGRRGQEVWTVVSQGQNPTKSCQKGSGSQIMQGLGLCGKECGWHSKCREAMSGFKRAGGECHDLILF